MGRIPRLIQRDRYEQSPAIAGLCFCVLALLSSCAKEAVKSLIDETRAPTRIIVEIRLDQAQMPNDKELKLRQAVADAIENAHIGVVAKSTADIGRMDVAVDVKDSVSSIPIIHDILRRLALDDRSTVRVDETHG